MRAVTSVALVSLVFVGVGSAGVPVLAQTAPTSLPMGDTADVAPQFRLIYSDPTDPTLQPVATFVRESGRLETCVSGLNDSLVLETDLTVRVMQGDGPVFYPDTNEIIMNYEFLADTEMVFRDGGLVETEDELQIALLDVIEWVLYHEVGHALVSQYAIPMVGPEEDAVDSLAAVLTLEFVESGADIAANAAALWLQMAESRELEDEDFWGAHSLDLQRFTAIICWMVGHDPQGEQSLASDFEFDQERTEACVIDYQQKVEAWMYFLDPHLRPDEPAPGSP